MSEAKVAKTLAVMTQRHWENFGGRFRALVMSVCAVIGLVAALALPAIAGIGIGSASAASLSAATTASASPVDLLSVSCPSTSNCTAVGETSDGSAGAIVATTDGGATWTTESLPSGVGTLASVSCPSASDCTAVGKTSAGTAGAIVATTDGGATWTTESVPSGVLGLPITALTNVSCPDTSDCEAVGQESGLTVGIWVATTDGGATWTTGSLREVDSDVTCSSTSFCDAVGNQQAEFITQLGALAWTTQAVGPVPAGLSSVACVGEDCQAVGQMVSPSTVGAVAFSTNGSAWTVEYQPGVPSGVGPLRGVSCPSASDCTAVGETSDGSAGAIVATTNGTATTYPYPTWTAESLPSGVGPLASVSCPSTSNCTAVGNGVIVATTDGGSTWTTEQLGSAGDSAEVVFPSSGATLSGTAILDGGATNPSAVATFQYELTGGSYTNHVVATAKPTFFGWLAEEADGTVGWDSTSVPSGTYTLTAVATYSDGTVVTSPGISITVSNPAPTAQVLIPSGGATVSGTTFLDGTASYTPNITQFTYDLDGSAIGNAFASPWGWLLLNWNTTTVANGSHTLTAVATYSDGATATSPGVTVTIANT